METTDRLNVIHARAAGVDVHKMQLTATVRLAQLGDQAQTFTRVFSARRGKARFPRSLRHRRFNGLCRGGR